MRENYLADLKLWTILTRRPRGVLLTRVGRGRVVELSKKGFSPSVEDQNWMEDYLKGKRSVRIHEKPITWYCDRLYNGDWFAQVGYSDAEWCCILGLREGEKTGLGQVLTSEHGKRLLDVLQRRHKDPRWLFAVPKCLFDMSRSIFSDGCIDWFLGQQGITVEGYERDMITDDLARTAGLYPLVNQLREMERWSGHRQSLGGRPMSIGMIGPGYLSKLSEMNLFPIRHFVEIETPNLHLSPHGIEDAVHQVIHYGSRTTHVWLVSAGVSAAVIIDRLYDRLPAGSYFMDCGSIWDAFVGAGGQREWRAELYADPVKLADWIRRNING